jgi:tetratricopeptide (TPR) repeat protein
MPRSTWFVLSVLFWTGLGSAQPQAAAQEKRGDAVGSDLKDAERRKAEELYDKAAELERAGRCDQAIRYYRDILDLDPANPLIHYRLGVCQQRLGLRGDAAQSFRSFLNTGHDGREVADGRSRLEELLLPELTKPQRAKWEEVTDYLTVAADLLPRVGRGGDEPSQLKSIDKSIELLLELKKETPAYLPIDARLGTAYQQKGDYEQAVLSYENYLKGFEKLDFAPHDQRDIRRQKIQCEEIISLKAKEEKRSRKEQAEKLQAKNAASEVSPSEAETKNFISQIGTFKEDWINGISFEREVSFNGDELIEGVLKSD